MNEETQRDIALTAAVLSAHYLKKSALIEHYDRVLDAAETFCRLFPQVPGKDWQGYLQKNKHVNVEGSDINPMDWEDLVVMYCAPLFHDLFNDGHYLLPRNEDARFTRLKLGEDEIVNAVHGVFGESASRLIAERKPTKKLKKEIEDDGAELMRYFHTLEECQAYAQGIDDMKGYQEYALTSTDAHDKIFGFMGAEVIKKVN